MATIFKAATGLGLMITIVGCMLGDLKIAEHSASIALTCAILVFLVEV